MKVRAMRATILGLCSLMFLVATGEGVRAHDGDLQRLLAKGQPKPFIGGQVVKVEGEVEVIHGDDFEGPRSFVRHFIRSQATQELLELGFDDPGSASLLTGHKVARYGGADRTPLSGSRMWRR